jgi:hypothetical protein
MRMGMLRDEPQDRGRRMMRHTSFKSKVLSNDVCYLCFAEKYMNAGWRMERDLLHIPHLGESTMHSKGGL